MSETSYNSYNLDHLGLISTMVDELGLEELVDTIIPQYQKYPFFEDEQEISLPNQTTINALQAAENGDYETVTLDSLRQQWDDL